jgi:glycerate 2-kinase
MHILIAPNAFKNSLDAASVATAIQEGIQQSKLKCSCECFPVGDGGDGTGDLLVKKLNGVFINALVQDPLGRKINTHFGLIDEGRTAVIEMANASGLRLLQKEELDPLHASTFGTGELVNLALDKNVNKIIIAIGGSATVDGGTGIAGALGIRFLDAGGNQLQGMPESLVDLASIDSSALDKKIRHCQLLVLCDVDNELLGDKGAAAVFGPQKGATAVDVQQLEKALTCFRNIILKQTGNDIAGIKHGGAAGGVAAGLAALLNAKLVKGIDYFLELTGFEKSLQKADLVITAEGSIDEQTLEGKGPFGVAQRAKEKNIPVIAVAGNVPLKTSAALQNYFDLILSINNEPVPLNTAIQNTAVNLQRTGKIIGDMLAIKTSK